MFVERETPFAAAGQHTTSRTRTAHSPNGGTSRRAGSALTPAKAFPGGATPGREVTEGNLVSLCSITAEAAAEWQPQSLERALRVRVVVF